MTAQWALDLMGRTDLLPVTVVAQQVVERFADGAAIPDEVPALLAFRDAVELGVPMNTMQSHLRSLSHAGYLRGAIVTMASALARSPRSDVALALARELMDALDAELGVALCRAVLVLPETDATRMDPVSAFVVANELLGSAMLERNDPAAALRHFEAILSVDVSDRRALRGWADATQMLQSRGQFSEHRSRGLALLDGLEDLEFLAGMAGERYELGRPLGRGRHAVVYQAHDRRVGRDVALKRLLDGDTRPGSTAPRVLEARFFAEARTLGRVRSPYVVALLDVQPKLRFIAMDLCHGGNLRLAMRRGLVGPQDMPRVGEQLRSALAAVHCAGAIHRDVKPANILVRESRKGSPVALADFGLAVGSSAPGVPGRAGTLRYLAPELRREHGRPLPASDRWSAGAVLLELARMPAPLPEAFDRVDADFDAAAAVPEDLPPPWSDCLRSLLSSDPEARTW